MTATRAFDLALWTPPVPANVQDGVVVSAVGPPFATQFAPLVTGAKPGVTVGSSMPAATAQGQAIVSGPGPAFAWTASATSSSLPAPDQQGQILVSGPGPGYAWMLQLPPIGSSAPPAMDGAASAGVGSAWSRSDHVHPSDTTKYNTTNPAGYQTAAQVSASIAASVPAPSSTPPVMDGVAAIGAGTTFARADHVHPVDTSRYAASNPAGYVTSVGAAGAAPVQSVAGKSGTVTLAHGDITDWTAALAPYAPLASPAFTAVPTAPTAALGTVTSQIATTAFVDAAVAADLYMLPTASTTMLGGVKIDGASITIAGGVISTALPAASSSLPAMDGTALAGVATVWSRGDHVHPTDTSRYAANNPAGYVTATAAASAAPVQSVATKTGAVTLNHNDITDWTVSLSAYALLASPAFSGAPTAPTATAGDSSTKIATTAFVASAVAGGTAGVASFNTRTGAVVLTSADVTAALTFTPYNSTNPAGYQTAANVTATLAPYALTASLPAASASTPIMDGTAAAGSATVWSRGDHVHPTDTSRYAASNPSGYQTAAQVGASITAATYVLPTASTTVLGGVKVDGATITISGGVISGAATLADAPSDGFSYVRENGAWINTLDSGTF